MYILLILTLNDFMLYNKKYKKGLINKNLGCNVLLNKFFLKLYLKCT